LVGEKPKGEGGRNDVPEKTERATREENKSKGVVVGGGKKENREIKKDLRSARQSIRQKKFFLTKKNLKVTGGSGRVVGEKKTIRREIGGKAFGPRRPKTEVSDWKTTLNTRWWKHTTIEVPNLKNERRMGGKKKKKKENGLEVRVVGKPLNEKRVRFFEKKKRIPKGLVRWGHSREGK